MALLIFRPYRDFKTLITRIVCEITPCYGYYLMSDFSMNYGTHTSAEYMALGYDSALALFVCAALEPAVLIIRKMFQGA